MAAKKYYVVVDEEGTTRWYKNSKCKVLHRENGPSVEYTDGTKYWHQNGRRHRTDGPAVEWCNGDKGWYINGQPHREDGPAVEWCNGDKEWYINGKRMTDADFITATQPAVEMTVADVEKLVGTRVKVIK